MQRNNKDSRLKPKDSGENTPKQKQNQNHPQCVRHWRNEHSGRNHVHDPDHILRQIIQIEDLKRRHHKATRSMDKAKLYEALRRKQEKLYRPHRPKIG